MFSDTGLVLYITLGLLFLLLIIFYNKQFTHIMGWSLLKAKKAHLKFQKIKPQEKEKLIDVYEDQIIEEIDKPAPPLLIGFFYLLTLILFWPLVVILPLFAFLLDIFYLND